MFEGFYKVACVATKVFIIVIFLFHVYHLKVGLYYYCSQLANIKLIKGDVSYVNQ